MKIIIYEKKKIPKIIAESEIKFVLLFMMYLCKIIIKAK